MLQIGAAISIALFFYWLFSKMIKAELSEKVEEIEIKIGSLEGKIDELYTIIYKLGNTIEAITIKSISLPGNAEPQKKRDPNSPGAIKTRQYRERKKKSPSRSEKMKTYWEKRREENIRASAVSAEKQLQALLSEKE